MDRVSVVSHRESGSMCCWPRDYAPIPEKWIGVQHLFSDEEYADIVRSINDVIAEENQNFNKRKVPCMIVAALCLPISFFTSCVMCVGSGGCQAPHDSINRANARLEKELCPALNAKYYQRGVEFFTQDGATGVGVVVRYNAVRNMAEHVQPVVVVYQPPPVAMQDGTTAFCRQCGGALPPSSVFCGKCGTKL